MATVIINNPSFINGVLYSCRTCFDPGNPIFSLKEECTDTKTWRDLLRDVAQLQVFKIKHKIIQFIPTTTFVL